MREHQRHPQQRRRRPHAEAQADQEDVDGRAGEAARLSGVEFSQSFPGIRGSQYKVEGVLLRALQSLRSDERGSKKGLEKKLNFSASYTGTDVWIVIHNSWLADSATLAS